MPRGCTRRWWGLEPTQSTRSARRPPALTLAITRRLSAYLSSNVVLKRMFIIVCWVLGQQRECWVLVATLCVSVPICMVSMPMYRLQFNDDNRHHRVPVLGLHTLQGRCVIARCTTNKVSPVLVAVVGGKGGGYEGEVGECAESSAPERCRTTIGGERYIRHQLMPPPGWHSELAMESVTLEAWVVTQAAILQRYPLRV